LIAYFISNISVKKYQNPFMCVKVLISQRWDFFLRHGVYSDGMPVRATASCQCSKQASLYLGIDLLYK